MFGARKGSDRSEVISEEEIGWSLFVIEILKRKFSVVFSIKYDLSGFGALQKYADIMF